MAGDIISYDVSITGNRHVTFFNPRGELVSVRRVTIFVGPYGPFTQDFAAGADSPAEIQTWIHNEKAAVVGLGNAV